jgi:phage gp46-like protein
MARDPRLVPLVGDYDGTSLNDLSNAVYLRITTPLGSYWADPELGSKLHLLQREKALQRVQLLAEQYTKSALQPLLDSRRADRITVQASAPQGGRMHLLADVFQRGQRVASFNHHVQVMQS